MLLTITTTYQPATDLGYLFYKHPERVQDFSLSFGQAYIFYPEATDEICTLALLVDIDPIRLSRKTRGQKSFALQPYVNDRPYVASSFLSVALLKIFRNAMNGQSKDRPELATKAIPLQVKLATLPSRGGESLVRQLFEPLGYKIQVAGYPLNQSFGEWGQSAYFTVILSQTVRLADLLTHLYVLLPVLDDDKHYWVGEEEIEKLLYRGESWLVEHPQREQITQRYLRHNKQLTRTALAQLLEEDDADPDQLSIVRDQEEVSVEQTLGLHQQRLTQVAQVLCESGARRVIDLGCGEGKLLQLLLEEKQFSHIAGMDVSHHRLSLAQKRLRLDRLPENQRERITLFQGSLIYRDQRLEEYDAAALVEVIEHLDQPRLAALEQTLFQFARPETIVLTTPNREYNIMWASLPAGSFRHQDHRFEWSRNELQMWAQRVGRQYGYRVEFAGIGEKANSVGHPSQMAIFIKDDSIMDTNNRFVQEELIATGGMGEVYRGRDTTSNKLVVIKRLKADMTLKNEEMVTRFIREGEALRRLDHPNIVKMLAVGEEGGHHFIVMEYVAGGTLRDLLDEHPQLPLKRTLDIIIELADALVRAHHLHIIHRDLKPANVLLTEGGIPRLTDFGVAHLDNQTTRLTQAGAVLGTVAYVSPEAFKSEDLDAGSDIWSLGVMLYEMLAGEHPFAAPQMAGTLTSILTKPLPDITQYRPDIPRDLITLIDQMLVKNRRHRIVSMRQVAAELERIRDTLK